MRPAVDMAGRAALQPGVLRNKQKKKKQKKKQGTQEHPGESHSWLSVLKSFGPYCWLALSVEELWTLFLLALSVEAGSQC